ncbi:MAG: serine/threonine protein phosphatase PrpC [Patiriisocius sp.]|jgi:serine/threonine protein phosphatase PrpC
MNLRGKIEVIRQTDVGRVRDHNEDYVSSDERLGLAVLADGMGGLLMANQILGMKSKISDFLFGHR